jgi:hypothetical protein
VANRVELGQLTAFPHLIGAADVDEQVKSVLFCIANSTATHLTTHIQSELSYATFSLNAVRALFADKIVHGKH